LGALCVSALAASVARGALAVGRHESVDIGATTSVPNASTGFRYAARYHAAGDPHGDPPALRRLVIKLPAGTRIDTSVPGRCTASDAEIMLIGASACPPSSRVGSGQATAKVVGLGTGTYDTVLYNARDQQIEVVESGNQVVGVVHTYVHGTTLDGPVPTCITGGQPPAGCPFDEVTLLANHLASVPISGGKGAGRRNYATTPKTCPRSGRWSGSVTFYYADGSVDTVGGYQPCRRPTTKPHRRLLAKHTHR
jgi:hypothetical protein